MPARDSHHSRYDGAMMLARHYAGGGGVSEIPEAPVPGEVPEPKPEPSWFDRATGFGGVLNKAALGVPGTVAALGHALGAGMLMRNPIDAYWRSQQSADEAFNQPTTPRDFKAGAVEYPGASVMRGSAAIAAHGIDNLLDAGVNLATILTPAMARKLEKAKILHPDDVGGSRRMEKVAQDYEKSGLRNSTDEAADKEFINKAWQEHGVAAVPNENGDFKPWSHFRHPSQVGLRMEDKNSYDGPLHGVYDDPVQYALLPSSRNANARITIDPNNKHWNGLFQPDEFRIEANGFDPKSADSIVKHELTHMNAALPAFDLPPGKHWKEYKPHLPEGVTTNAVEATRQRMNDMIEQAAKSPMSKEAAELALEKYGRETLPFNKRFAQYLDHTMTPGEYLARMEQILNEMQARGINPRSRRLTEIDDLDLRDAMGPTGDLRHHRLYEKPRASDD